MQSRKLFVLFVCRLSTVCMFMKISNEPPHDKTNKMALRPAKTQISLGIRPV